MIEFFRKLFTPESSGATARERLRLVLLSDHLSLAPDVVESLRADLIAVISKYVEVDEKNCDVSFEQQDRAVAVLANIPIVSMRSRPTPPNSSAPPVDRSQSEQPSVASPAASFAALDEPEASNTPSTDALGVPPPAKRRRRRRRSGAKAVTAAAG